VGIKHTCHPKKKFYLKKIKQKKKPTSNKNKGDYKVFYKATTCLSISHYFEQKNNVKRRGGRLFLYGSYKLKDRFKNLLGYIVCIEVLLW
jgi:ribosome biogenesis protein Nip4